jgi:hypothetical protein
MSWGSRAWGPDSVLEEESSGYRVGPVRRHGYEPHVLIELNRGGHRRESIDAHSLVPECSSSIEERVRQTRAESRPPMVGPYVDSFDLSDLGSHFSKGSARHHGVLCERENDFATGRTVGSRKLRDLLVDLLEAHPHDRTGGSGLVLVIGEPLPIILEEAADGCHICRPVHRPKRSFGVTLLIVPDWMTHDVSHIPQPALSDECLDVPP